MPTGWTREYKPKNSRRHCRPLDLTPPSNITLNPEERTIPQDQPKTVIAKKTYKEAEKSTYKYPPFVGKNNKWTNGKLSELTVHEHLIQLPTKEILSPKNTLEQLTIDLFVCRLSHKALKPTQSR